MSAAAASAYASQYPPSVAFDAAYSNFFERFYATSDTPDAHETYVNFFTEDATLIMASSKAVGRQAILALRTAMWEKVESRAHAPLKIFPFGPDASEVMLYGSVRYGLKAGGESCKDWAARAHLVKDGHGKVMMDFYQVYLDTATAA
ncbi:hypothetical protein ACJQWK_07526 [Exserohilum turcicum]|uniref:SnoaL-like domain-containing protein n=1 Tax=Exserohilum turcicum (strain 28A) TaxID=671987 RepID=R0KR00_EXST2|nr:uncharacterized protein SETTUDRAFT_145881 [Exserohilum turcica Et28A]EOA90222.1 hypothetical protein SETTUDRAFT_145881 [Exserohilum turcica Et28A]